MEPENIKKELTEEKKAMCGSVNLFIFLNLLIDSFISFFTTSSFFLLSPGGATAEAPHDIRPLRSRPYSSRTTTPPKSPEVP